MNSHGDSLRRFSMRRMVALIVALVVLGLCSPLMATENPPLQNGNSAAVASAPLTFMNPAAVSTPLQCASESPVLIPDLNMTGRECAETCGGCCVCWQFNTKCVDWECC